MKFFSLAAVFAATLAGGAAHAATQSATLDFTGNPAVPSPFTITPSGSTPITNGQCDVAPCVVTNSAREVIISITSPLTFSVSEFWFRLIGSGADLHVTTSKTVVPVSLDTSSYDSGTGYVYSTSANDAFQGITSISFLMDSSNNGRVDTLKVTWDDGVQPAPIPLPATAALLPLGIGALAMVRRRKKT